MNRFRDVPPIRYVISKQAPRFGGEWFLWDRLERKQLHSHPRRDAVEEWANAHVNLQEALP